MSNLWCFGSSRTNINAQRCIKWTYFGQSKCD